MPPALSHGWWKGWKAPKPLTDEFSAKILARGLRVKEVPIRYFPRSRAEGKKIGFRDWGRAVRTFFRYRHG